MTSVVHSPGNPNLDLAERAKNNEWLKPLAADKARMLIQPLLKGGVTYEQILSEVFFAIQANPLLADCTPASLIRSVADCVKWDLIIGEKVYLVPFNVKVKDSEAPNGERWESRAQAIRDYKGDIELVVRAGAARFVDAHNFYENEPFEYEQGTNPFIKHKPLSPAARGKLLGSYAVAKINAYDVKIVVLYRDEIDAVRKKHSKQHKAGTLEEIPWYGPKTCVHRVCKMIPNNPKLAEVLRAFAIESEDPPAGDDTLPPGDRIDAPALAAPAEPSTPPTRDDEPVRETAAAKPTNDGLNF